MMKPNRPFFPGILIFVFGLCTVLGEPESGASWRAFQASAKIEIEDSTLKVQGKDVPAISARIPASQSSFNTALIAPLEDGSSLVQTVSFRVKVPDSAPRTVIVALFGKDWYLKDNAGKPLPVKKFTEASPEYVDGELEIVWEIGSLLAAAEETETRQLIFIYPTNELPEGTAVDLTLSEVTFR
ncbi:MAG: hypothetical protein IAE94_01365 [Chthoniobacterales bacterium]|nr:hypothetical protein [Chthoniobacterales bacterium]